MLPQDLFLGITMYDLLFAGGVVAALVVFRLVSDRLGMSAKMLNFVLADGVASILVGVFSAVLFQAIYNYQRTGVFELTANTGMTFYGGFVGGAVTFFAVYFGVGHLAFRDGEHLRSLFTVTNIGSCSVAAAHCLGRLGCLCAGCCHGIHAEPPLGWYMQSVGDTVLPTQLYEAIFLAALFVVLVRCTLRRGRYVLPIYLCAYGVWRFALEYIRGDERGSSLVAWLTPSQFTAICLILCGVAFWAIEQHFGGRGEVAAEDGANDSADGSLNGENGAKNSADGSFSGENGAKNGADGSFGGENGAKNGTDGSLDGENGAKNGADDSSAEGKQ